MNKRKYTLVTVLFLFSTVFFTFPQTSIAGTPALAGCCQLTPDTCTTFIGQGGADECIGIGGGTPFFGAECDPDSGLCLGIPSNVPTISEWGMIAMAAVLGVIGFMVIRRRQQVV